MQGDQIGRIGWLFTLGSFKKSHPYENWAAFFHGSSRVNRWVCDKVAHYVAQTHFFKIIT
jgi:hypothetical protein